MKDKYDNKTIDAFKPKPKTNAERQRAYRERNSDAGDLKRIDTLIDVEHHFWLKEIARLNGETMRQTLERIIKNEYETTPGHLARIFGLE